MSSLASVPRLAAVLGLLGSEHDGEALAAARMAERLRRQMGATWGDLLQPNGVPHADPNGWRATVATCRARPELLTDWERKFLDVLASYDHAPSAKQAATLDQLAARIKATAR